MGEILLDRGPEGTDIDYQMPPGAVDDLKVSVGSSVTVFMQTIELEALVPDPDFSTEVIRHVTERGILVDVKPEELVVYQAGEGGEDGKDVTLLVGIAIMDEGSADTRPFVGFRSINSIIIKGEIYTFQPSR